MTNTELERTAAALVARGKGILAADETVGTLTKRFDALKIESTPVTRRDYREMLVTTPGAADFITGVILYDETLRQQGSDGKPQRPGGGGRHGCAEPVCGVER